MRVTKLLLLLMTLLAIFSPYPVYATEPEPIDCSNLLILLAKTLHAVEGGEPNALQIIRSIGSASIPGDLGNLHKNSYEVLLRYYNLSVMIVNEALAKKEAQKVIEELSKLYSRLPEVISRYVSRLSACSHDVGLSDALRTIIYLSIKKISGELIPHLSQVVFSRYLVLGDLVDVELSRDVYASGELIEFEVMLGSQSLVVNSASLLTWPDLRLVGYANISSLGSGRYAGSLKTPSAESVRTLTRPEITFVLVITVHNTTSNESYKSYKLFRVTYRVPAVSVEFPSRIFRGDFIGLKIYSDGHYNATIKLNDLLLNNVSLTPGSTSYYINTSELNLTVGINLVEVSVSPTQNSVGLRITRRFLVLPKTPKAEVVVPRTFFTSDGFLTIRLVNEDPGETQLRVKVYVGNSLRGEYLLNSTLVARVFIGALPASLVPLKVVVESSQLGKEPYLYEHTVFVVNPLNTLLMSLVLIFLIVLVHSRERSFIILIQGRVEESRASLWRAVKGVSVYLMSPYVISSRVVDLYYATLKKLGIPLPEVTETLREHFSRVSLSSFLRGIIWKFLVLAEKDLYSRKRQDYQEALKLAEEAVRSENERAFPD